MSGGLLVGRVALVTGGARGIGLAVGRKFVAHGANVVLGDRDSEVQTAAAKLSRETGRTVSAVEIDVANAESTSRAFDEAERLGGPVDVVVANAGILTLAPALDLEEAAFRRVLDVNLVGAFLTCREGARRMVDRGVEGRIIVSSSLFGIRGGRDNAAYSASKFGTIGLVQSLAADLGPHGILVNAVCPGQIRTDMMTALVTERSAAREVPEEVVEAELTARIPQGRMATVDEVADTYVYLASPLSRYVTGQAHVVDGGWLVG